MTSITFESIIVLVYCSHQYSFVLSVVQRISKRIRHKIEFNKTEHVYSTFDCHQKMEKFVYLLLLAAQIHLVVCEIFDAHRDAELSPVNTELK